MRVLYDLTDKEKVVELRRLLRPMLSNPYRQTDGWNSCCFCLSHPYDDGRAYHQPDCPVLNRSDILGDYENG